MSTVDLTKVAGFKAVDAEGNDLGIVSLQDMTNMVKESIVQEAVAMQSVSTLAETSTLAATDTYEDQLPTSDTFSYVRTLDSSGNPKLTSSNAFASVVGGLLPTVTNGSNGLATKENYRLRIRQTDSVASLSGYYKIASIILNEFYAGLIQVGCNNLNLYHICIANHVSNNSARVKILSGANDGSVSFYYSGTLGSGAVDIYAKVGSSYKTLAHTPLMLRYNGVEALNLEDVGSFSEIELTQIPIL